MQTHNTKAVVYFDICRKCDPKDKEMDRRYQAMPEPKYVHVRCDICATCAGKCDIRRAMFGLIANVEHFFHSEAPVIAAHKSGALRLAHPRELENDETVIYTHAGEYDNETIDGLVAKYLAMRN